MTKHNYDIKVVRRENMRSTHARPSGGTYQIFLQVLCNQMRLIRGYSII